MWNYSGELANGRIRPFVRLPREHRQMPLRITNTHLTEAGKVR